ncbi:frigida-like protein 1 [Quercus suber]|uniref:FRIGIDA-like protein n=1 Tax=Quercus suber TaxID=58331 RepID=A0AAW0KQR9_QUESU
MRLEVGTALRLSSDPAKLGFTLAMKKGDVEFDESIVQGSCVLLLEQLFKLSPSIKPDVKQEAMRLAIEWRVKLRVDTQHSLEVLASYGLASAFDDDELIMYLEKVSEYEQLPGLCQILGVDNMAPGKFSENWASYKLALLSYKTGTFVAVIFFFYSSPSASLSCKLAQSP